MSDPGRLRDEGREEDRALLRQAIPPVPSGLQQQLRQSLEARLAGGRSRASSGRRLTWIALGLLGTGSAFAMSVPAARDAVRDRLFPGTRPVTDRSDRFGERAPTPDWQPHAARPLPGSETPSAPSPSASDRAHPRPVARPPAPAPQTAIPPALVQHPELRLPGGTPWLTPASAGLDGTPSRTAPAAPTPLRIVHHGRLRGELRASADRVEGRVRGVTVALRIEGALLSGKIGEQPVSLFLRQRGAHGTIAGEDLGFTLSETEAGGIVRGQVPSHTISLELGRQGLTIFPACAAPLPELAGSAGSFRGRCADGRDLEVTLPPAFRAMPLFPRLLILGILLADRDPVLRERRPGLFPEAL